MEKLAMNQFPAEGLAWEGIPLPPEQVLNLVPDFVGVADPSGRWLFINRSGREMVGLRGDSVTGYWIHDFFPDWGIARLEQGTNGDGIGGGWTPKGKLRTREGRDVRVSHAVIAHTDDESNISCFTVIARGAFSPTGATAPERIELDKVLRESLDRVRQTLNGSVTIAEAFTSNNAAVFADPTQMRHMVMNLCLSSAQSMREGGGEITVNTNVVAIKGPNEPGGSALRAGKYVRLTIRDNGPGIEPALAPHVFDPGAAEGGPGSDRIGLWDVRRNVIDSGGDIFVETAPGRGTAFHVYMPISGTNGNGSVPY